MARRKPPSKSPQPGATSLHERGQTSTDVESAVVNPSAARELTVAEARWPEPWQMALIGAVILVHLAMVLISYSAIIEPSGTHSQLLDAASPYLRATHFSADGRPFYLAHGSPEEQPHRLQVASRGASANLEIDRQTEWTTIEPQGIAGLAASDRYGRWMKLVSTLAQSDRPSLAAALLMPLVAADESIDAVRIIRLPTELTTPEQDAAPPVYLARVVRQSEDIRLVSIGSKRLSTFPRETEATLP